MKAIRAILLLLTLGLSTYGQGITITASAIKVETVTGDCRAGGVRLKIDGTIQTCQSGTWGDLSTGGGGLSGLTVGNIPYADTSSSLAASPLSRTSSTAVALTGTLNGMTFLTANTSSFLAVSGSTPALTSGTENTALGYQALAAVTNAIRNTAVGNQALKLNTGYYNTAVGAGALAVNVSGWNLTAVGRGALAADISSGENTAVGSLALTVNTTGNANTAVGYNALGANLTGIQNTAVGYGALAANQSASGNTAIGRNAANATTGADNVAIGSSALVSNITGTWNMAVGTNALSATTGSNNTAVGVNSGFTNTTGGSNTFIGQAADASAGNLSKATAIGYGAIVSASNSLVLGGTGSNAVSVGINTATPAAQFDVRPSSSSTVGQIIRLASGQTANGFNIENSAGTFLSGFLASGALRVVSLADGDAPTNSIYYSTTASKLVFKDSGGTVNALY